MASRTGGPAGAGRGDNTGSFARLGCVPPKSIVASKTSGRSWAAIAIDRPVPVDDLALAAVRDHPQLGAAFVGSDERDVVFVGSHAAQQIRLHVFERLRIAAGRDPGGRHDQRDGARIDELARDGGDASVGADEHAERAELRRYRRKPFAGSKPQRIEMP